VLAYVSVSAAVDVSWLEITDISNLTLDICDFTQRQRRARGGAVLEALRYKPEGRGVDSRWCHWNFSLT
jgi:hypothetical protein